jgi:hypothetical protein
VWLEYNCYYMEAICQNARAWLNKPTSQARPFPDTFGFDFDAVRKNWRRERESCPSNWINRHSCPEVAGVPAGNLAQPQSYRYIIATDHLEAWPHTDLEPSPGNNRELKSRRNANGNLIEAAKLHYTCDEWPPATFIQGGTGASTRCAAMRCTVGISAEQNWQGNAHNELRKALQNLMIRDQSWPNFNSQTQAVLVRFRFRTQQNRVPVSIITYDANAVETNFDIPFRKRQEGMRLPRDMSTMEFMHWASSVHMDDLLGNYTGTQKHDVALNSTAAAIQKLGISDPLPWWNAEFEDVHTGNPDVSQSRTALARDLENTTAVGSSSSNIDMIRVRGKEFPRPDPKPASSPAAKSKRLLAVPNDTDPTIMPLAKSATLDDLERARKIVDDAVAESAKRNQARHANPARNVYRLKPGTVVGNKRKLRRQDVDAVEPPPPLLEITPEIAAAAALVAEAEAVDELGNLTKRAVVAPRAGTFWMESIARKGTVPWGDDPSYKVFRNVKDYGAKGDGITVINRTPEPYPLGPFTLG